MAVLALGLAAFFALNMGGSGMSPAFAAPYGSGALGRKTAALLFGLFVLLGAFIGGDKVVTTISGGIVHGECIDLKVTLVILLSAAISLFIANLLNVSVSTSSVTVFSLISVGLYYRKLYALTLVRIFGFWLALPFVAYALAYVLGRCILPLEQTPWVREHGKYMKLFVITTGCFVAFSIGSNNVANAVGPLVASDLVSRKMGFLLIAPFFGIGGLVFRRVLDTVGKDITRLGVLGATLNGAVIGTLLLLSSTFGMPEPMVMLDATSIMGIGSVNRGHAFILTHKVIRKIISLWIISPLIALVVTYLLLVLINQF
jgi:sulfate permease